MNVFLASLYLVSVLLSCTLRIKAISPLSWISISNTRLFQRLAQQGRKLDIILDTLIPTIIDFLPGIKKVVSTRNNVRILDIIL